MLIAVVSPLSARAQNEAVSQELGEIVVTSTRNRRSFEQQPTRIEVLGGEEINEKDVTFKYRYWLNYFINKTADVELGDGGFDTSIANDPGRINKFESFLSFLPSELRRAGRDVLGDLRRRIPIGDLTGGRVFPPFF